MLIVQLACNGSKKQGIIYIYCKIVIFHYKHIFMHSIIVYIFTRLEYVAIQCVNFSPTWKKVKKPGMGAAKSLFLRNYPIVLPMLSP